MQTGGVSVPRHCERSEAIQRRLIATSPSAPRNDGTRHVGCSVWCYFNNDIHGHAIHDARTLKSMVGQTLR